MKPSSRRGIIGGALAALALAGCKGLAPDPAAEAVAKLAYQRLNEGDVDGLEAMLAPQARGPHDKEMFAKMKALIPSAPLVKVQTVNWRSFVGTGGKTQSFQHTYDYGGQVVTASSVLVPGPSGAWVLRSFNVDVGFSPTAPRKAEPEKSIA